MSCEKDVPEKNDAAEKSTPDKDQLEKSYYYDDAHGYEIYNPNDDEEDADSVDENLVKTKENCPPMSLS